jgi:hypothetical protein
MIPWSLYSSFPFLVVIIAAHVPLSPITEASVTAIIPSSTQGLYSQTFCSMNLSEISDIISFLKVITQGKASTGILST